MSKLEEELSVKQVLRGDQNRLREDEKFFYKYFEQKIKQESYKKKKLEKQ